MSRRAFQDITNAALSGADSTAALGTKKTLKSERKADDVDARDASNPQAVTEYVNDMYAHFREKELETSVNPTYMSRQAHINEKMRAILIDWLVEVHLKFKLVPETLYLTVNLIDRYLLGSPVERSNLQLVGVSALLLASKYEEIYPPELKDLVYITDKAYTQEQILSMEEKMVKALKYKMTIASIHCFMMRYLKAGHADRRMVWLASYVAERMLQEYAMLKYLPSMVAACAVYIARKNLGRNAWSPTLLHYAQYTESSLRACLEEMSSVIHSTKGSLQAVKKKYSSEKYGQVALMQLKVLD
jgi:cyclin B|mmetsp:Transcript_32667/g.110904  ORF Transcript_32667/g.110904 Transcript_32667/m.110904 type:complete len:302 (-) Transcript_32667:204-1109(-)